MMRFLRSQSQTVLIIILGVLGLSFLFYGNVGNLLAPSAGRPSDTGRIDGEEISVADMIAQVHNTRDALALEGQEPDSSQPGANAQVAQQAWNQLLILHEADQLHISVSDQEVLTYIQGRPEFQKNGVYSPELYQTMMTNLQNGRHISPDRFEAFVRDLLRSQAAFKALLSTVHTPLFDLLTQFEKYNGPVQVSVIHFDPKSFAGSTPVTSQEIEAQYKAHPENPAYRTPEKRKVDYVLFLLSPAQTKLPEKEKAAAIETLGEKALEFALVFQPDPTASPNPPSTVPDFMAETKKRGLNAVTTDFFTAETTPAGLPPSPAFNNAAFSLTKDDPISKVTQLENGVAVLHLVEIQPSDLRPLAEVSANIAKELQSGKDAQAAEAAARNAAPSLQAAVAKGTDFKAAAAALNLKVETLPSFVPVKAPQSDPQLQRVAYATIGMKPGEVSNPIPTSGDQLLIIHLDSRGKADPAGMAEFQARYTDSQDQELRNRVIKDWVDWKSRQSGTHKPANLNDYGNVE